MVRGANEIPIGAKAMRRRPGRLSTTRNTCVFIRLQLELFSPVLERNLLHFYAARSIEICTKIFNILCIVYNVVPK
jgi:hypothetical protein